MKLVAVDDEPLVLDVLVKAIRKAEAGCEGGIFHSCQGIPAKASHC